MGSGGRARNLPILFDPVLYGPEVKGVELLRYLPELRAASVDSEEAILSKKLRIFKEATG